MDSACNRPGPDDEPCTHEAGHFDDHSWDRGGAHTARIGECTGIDYCLKCARCKGLARAGLAFMDRLEL